MSSCRPSPPLAGAIPLPPPFVRAPNTLQGEEGAKRAEEEAVGIGCSLAMLQQTRVKKKDPEAIHYLGSSYYQEGLGLQKDMRKAAELWAEAAELGSIGAQAHLGGAYLLGEGVQEDKAKAVELYKKAAMQGHVESRYILGIIEYNGGSDNRDSGSDDRAVKHLIISAKMGHKGSVEKIKELSTAGVATKEQYAEALKGFQDALEQMKSHDRDEAKRLVGNKLERKD